MSKKETLTQLLNELKKFPTGTGQRTWQTNTVRWLRNCKEDFGRVAPESLDKNITIAQRLLTVTVTPVHHEVEFRLDGCVAYGWYNSSQSYAVMHAPSQHEFDRIAGALDAGAQTERQVTNDV